MAPTIRKRSPLFATREGFYEKLMDQYAAAGEGLAYLLTSDNPVGDIAYAPYKWTAAQHQGWHTSQEVPCELRNLPSDTPITFQSLHIPEDKDRVYEPGAFEFGRKHVQDIRISKKQFLRLQQLALPGSRIWMRDAGHNFALMLPSYVLMFTEEEKTKYHENKFKKDGSDMPTINGMMRRFEESYDTRLTRFEDKNAASTINLTARFECGDE